MGTDLLSNIHGTVHNLMSEGSIPACIELGWEEYGQLHRALTPESDSPMIRSLLGLRLVLVPTPNHLRVRTAGWRF